MTANEPVSVIGLPYLMGTRAPGVFYQMARGPEVLLSADALPAALAPYFTDVETELIEDADDATDEDNGGDFRVLPRGDQMSRVLVQNMHLARHIRAARERGRFPLVAGGTCSSALGVVGGISGGGRRIGMIWLDAHGDAQTPDTSASGFIEGMPVTTIAGLCWPRWRAQIPGFEVITEDRIVTIGNHEMYAPGGRGPSDGSKGALGRVIDPPVIAEAGFEAALTDALDDLAQRVDAVYIHFDADVIDPSELRASTHVAPGGLTVQQVLRVFEEASRRYEVLAVNVSAWDPAVDPRGLDVLLPLLTAATRLAGASRKRAEAAS